MHWKNTTVSSSSNCGSDPSSVVSWLKLQFWFCLAVYVYSFNNFYKIFFSTPAWVCWTLLYIFLGECWALSFSNSFIIFWDFLRCRFPLTPNNFIKCPTLLLLSSFFSLLVLSFSSFTILFSFSLRSCLLLWLVWSRLRWWSFVVCGYCRNECPVQWQRK